MQKIVKNRQQFPGRGTVVIQKFLSHQTLGTAFTHEDDGFYEYAAGILLSGYAILSEMKNAWLTSRRRIGPI